MILALLYGEGDFDRTLAIGCMCGWDTDCNVTPGRPYTEMHSSRIIRKRMR